MTYKLVIILDRAHKDKYGKNIREAISDTDLDESEYLIISINKSEINDDSEDENNSDSEDENINPNNLEILKDQTDEYTIFFVLSHGNSQTRAIPTEETGVVTYQKKWHISDISKKYTGEFFDHLHTLLKHHINGILASCWAGLVVDKNQIKEKGVSLLVRSSAKYKTLTQESFKALKDVILAVSKGYNYPMIVKYLLAHDPETFWLQIGIKSSDSPDKKVKKIKFDPAGKFNNTELEDIGIDRKNIKTTIDKKSFGFAKISGSLGASDKKINKQLKAKQSQKLSQKGILEHLKTRSDQAFSETNLPSDEELEFKDDVSDSEESNRSERNLLKRTLFQNLNRGNFENAFAILKANPDLAYIEDKDGNNLLTIANRRKAPNYLTEYLIAAGVNNEISVFSQATPADFHELNVDSLNYAVQKNMFDHAYEILFNCAMQHKKYFDSIYGEQPDFGEQPEIESDSLLNLLSDEDNKSIPKPQKPTNLIDDFLSVAKQNHHEYSAAEKFLEDISAKPLIKNILGLASEIIPNKTSINLADQNGRTPLMIAAMIGDVKLTEKLLKYGGDINIKDRKGRTAYDFALEKFLDEFVNSGKHEQYRQILNLLNKQIQPPETEEKLEKNRKYWDSKKNKPLDKKKSSPPKTSISKEVTKKLNPDKVKEKT